MLPHGKLMLSEQGFVFGCVFCCAVIDGLWINFVVLWRVVGMKPVKNLFSDKVCVWERESKCVRAGFWSWNWIWDICPYRIMWLHRNWEPMSCELNLSMKGVAVAGLLCTNMTPSVSFCFTIFIITVHQNHEIIEQMWISDWMCATFFFYVKIINVNYGGEIFCINLCLEQHRYFL